jgi:hypothetical protein
LCIHCPFLPPSNSLILLVYNLQTPSAHVFPLISELTETKKYSILFLSWLCFTATYVTKLWSNSLSESGFIHWLGTLFYLQQVFSRYELSIWNHSYRIPSLDSILSQFYSRPILTTYLTMIHLNGTIQMPNETLLSLFT